MNIFNLPNYWLDVNLFILILLVFLVGCVDSTVPESPTTNPVGENIPEEKGFLGRGLQTNTALHSIPLNQILDGGPGKDRIPALNNPLFLSLSSNGAEYSSETRGIVVGMEDPRFYPISILVWHEIVNDVVDDTPVAVTFCPLCGSAIVFDRRVGDEALVFGVSGLLYQSNLLMYDQKTESLWSQAQHESVVGGYVGKKLSLFPSSVMTLGEFSALHPNGKILSTETGYSRDYGRDPYGDYEENDDFYFPIADYGKDLPAKTIVYAVPHDGALYLFPLDALIEEGSATIPLTDGFITVQVEGGNYSSFKDGTLVPGYFSMYFSTTLHHPTIVIWESTN